MILDTNAISALADGSPEFELALRDVGAIELPVIALGEFRFGILRSRHRQRYDTWLAALVGASRVLLVDELTAATYSGIRESLRRRGRPIPSNDTWIAALALQHDLPIASRDAHFDEVEGVRRVQW